MECSKCGKELEEKDFEVTWRRCSFCKIPVCDDCIHYMAVKRKGLYKEYIETLPVCEKCTPKKKVDEKLLGIVDEILGKE